MRGVRVGWWILWNLVIKLLSLFCWIFECYFWTWLWKLHKLMLDFWGLNGAIGLEIKGFDDTWYDKVFGDENWDFGWFCWGFWDWVDGWFFWVGVWMNQLWDCAGNKLAAGVLTTPMPRYFYIFPSKWTVVRSGATVHFFCSMNEKSFVSIVSVISKKEKFKKVLTNN